MEKYKGVQEQTERIVGVQEWVWAGLGELMGVQE
jgi:hypothetical protein